MLLPFFPRRLHASEEPPVCVGVLLHATLLVNILSSAPDGAWWKGLKPCRRSGCKISARSSSSSLRSAGPLGLSRQGITLHLAGRRLRARRIYSNYSVRVFVEVRGAICCCRAFFAGLLPSASSFQFHDHSTMLRMQKTICLLPRNTNDVGRGTSRRIVRASAYSHTDRPPSRRRKQTFRGHLLSRYVPNTAQQARYSSLRLLSSSKYQQACLLKG